MKKESREDEFGPGIKIKLDKKLKSGGTLRDKLSTEIIPVLKEEIEAQKPRLDKLIEWNNLYMGKRKPKTYPTSKAANCAIPFTRTMAEAVIVRLIDVIWGSAKMWIAKAKTEAFKAVQRDIEDGLDWWQRNIVKLREKSYPALLQAVKTGLGIVKLEYVKKKRTVCEYATDEEIKDKNIKKYNVGEETPVVKRTISVFDGPDVFPIDRADWVISSDATNLNDAFLCGFKTKYRKQQLESKAKQGFFDKDIVDKLTTSPSDDDIKAERAKAQDYNPKNWDRNNYNIWEIWTSHDVDGDGEEDSIVLYIHLESGEILNAIYNPHFYGFRPFIVFKGNPVEYRFDGEGAVEILEPVQREIDSMHNQRIDRINHIINPPRMWRDGAAIDADDMEDLYPGKNVVVDDIESATAEMLSQGVTPSSIQEEQMLIQYGREAIGVSPDVLGQPTAERPVAKEMQARLTEANKKFKFLIDNARYAFGDMGMMALELMGQSAPTYMYMTEVEGVLQKKVINFPTEYIRDGVEIELRASSEMMNQEVRREIGLQKYTLMSDFNTKVAGMVQLMTDPRVPQEMRMYLFEVAKVSAEMMKDILRDFNEVEPETIVKIPQQLPMPQMPRNLQMMGQQQGQAQPPPGMIQ